MVEATRARLEVIAEEIRELESTDLFNNEEIKILIKKRKYHEFKISGATKTLDDYVEYIQYEKVVLKDLRLRLTKSRTTNRNNPLMLKIINRIKYLYEVATQRFGNDFYLYISYFKFLKKSNCSSAASVLIKNMMRNFPHSPQVWQLAAGWFIKKDMKFGLNVIHQGLTLNPDSKLLYCEAIQLELFNRAKEQEIEDENAAKGNDLLFSKKLNEYLQSACKHIDDSNFLLGILVILQKNSSTKILQDTLVDRLLDKYWDDEIVWHSLAQRELKGHHYKVPPELKTISPNFGVKQCVNFYERGIKKISPGKLVGLWSHYLNWLIDRVQQNIEMEDDYIKKETLLEALKTASVECPTLDEKYFVAWANLMESENDIMNIVQQGLDRVPQSLELWKLKLKYAVMRDNTNKFNESFKEAISYIQERAAPLWLMAIRYHCLTSSNRVIEDIYQRGIKQPEQVSNVLKPEYLQWVALTKSISDARKQYNLIAKEKPYCKEMHNVMAKLEMLEIDVRLEELENVYKLACEQFGKTYGDVYVSLIEFYCKYNEEIKRVDPSFDINEKILAVYRNAESKLPPDHLLFNDLKEGLVKIWRDEEVGKTTENPFGLILQTLKSPPEKTNSSS